MKGIRAVVARHHPIVLASALAVAALGSCRLSPAGGHRPIAIAEIEARYQETRALRDAIDVTRSRGALSTTDGVALGALLSRYGDARAELSRALAAGAAPPLSEEDMRALAVMRRTLAEELVADEAAVTAAGAGDAPPDCAYDPELVIAAEGGHEALSERMYACFATAAQGLAFDGESIDRLTVFARLPLTADPARRKRLWLALRPIWEGVNADDTPRSPYRTLMRARDASPRDTTGEPGDAVRAIGVEPEVMEEWLVAVLERWRDVTPDAPIEPWDFAWRAGRASRELGPAIPLSSLRQHNDLFYAELGADPGALDVEYDLEPRAGKDPVAFTTFGRRPQRHGAELVPGVPWVFASYRVGGLDNLLELLHETGHAVHIAAIRTRPAFTDWPDSDVFTEALAELAALDVYEPAWQRRHLGRVAPIDANIAAKYAGIVMDIAWALFELRMQRDPRGDPNALWTEITHGYFRIAPHPELSWWAVRGQLVDFPGYMMNYAAGAILAADLRARMRELAGEGPGPDPAWYARASEALFRFGLEKSSKDVIEEFLGRPVSPRALLEDMARVKEGDAGSGS